MAQIEKRSRSVINNTADRLETVLRTLLICFWNSSSLLQEFLTNSTGIIQK
jgi:hypothetical protein